MILLYKLCIKILLEPNSSIIRTQSNTFIRTQSCVFVQMSQLEAAIMLTDLRIFSIISCGIILCIQLNTR